MTYHKWMIKSIPKSLKDRFIAGFTTWLLRSTCVCSLDYVSLELWCKKRQPAFQMNVTASVPGNLNSHGSFWASSSCIIWSGWRIFILDRPFNWMQLASAAARMLTGWLNRFTKGSLVDVLIWFTNCRTSLGTSKPSSMESRGPIDGRIAGAPPIGTKQH